MSTPAEQITNYIQYNIDTLNRVNAGTNPIRVLDLAEIREIAAVARGMIEALRAVIDHGASLETRMENSRREWALREEIESAAYNAHYRVVAARTSRAARVTA